MKHAELYQRTFNGLTQQGISAFTEIYAGKEKRQERIGKDGLVLRAPALEGADGLLCYTAFTNHLHSLLKGKVDNLVVMQHLDGSLEVYAYYHEPSDEGRDMELSDLCCWIDDEPSNFNLGDSSGVCPSAWYNGWDCDLERAMPRRLYFLYLLSTATVITIKDFRNIGVNRVAQRRN